MMICEDNNPWPVSRFSEPPTPDRQLEEVQDLYQEYYQAAEGQASKDAAGSITDRMLVATAVIAVVLTLVIALVVLTQVFGGEEIDAVTTAVLG